METNPLKEGALTNSSTGPDLATRGLLRKRAMELAVINGRSALDATQSDWEQARRELSGEPDADASLLESGTIK